jgi:hypothetical protein
MKLLDTFIQVVQYTTTLNRLFILFTQFLSYNKPIKILTCDIQNKNGGRSDGRSN